MAGRITFHFETEGVKTALERACNAAGDVTVAGGPSTLNAYLTAGLVDQLRLHIVPSASRWLVLHPDRPTGSHSGTNV